MSIITWIIVRLKKMHKAIIIFAVIMNVGFCGCSAAKEYHFTFTKYKRYLGQIGSTKYNRRVSICMCNNCKDLINKRQDFKNSLYRIIIIISILLSIAILVKDASVNNTSIINAIFIGLGAGLFLGMIPAWFITSKFVSNSPKKSMSKKLRSFNEHPNVIAARKDGFKLD